MTVPASLVSVAVPALTANMPVPSRWWRQTVSFMSVHGAGVMVPAAVSPM